MGILTYLHIILVFFALLNALQHCGIGAKQEMELLPCDLTSCYLYQSFTDLQKKGHNLSKNQTIKKNKKIKYQNKNQKFDYLIIYLFLTLIIVVFALFNEMRHKYLT